MTDTRPEGHHRTFLVVVDETEEMSVALNYAARRARNSGGRVALLHVMEPGEFQQWSAVEALMKHEQREQAEQLLQRLAKTVLDISGTLPCIHLVEGKRSEELMRIVENDRSISILVLAAGTGRAGPGPLINYMVGQMSGSLRIPVTVVPGGLNEAQLDILT
ncbi:universal stress protein [Rhodocista pekingensis]|uniref:Universal stress protein n=1 Tax=Rhodocista pekingensis TaxID=201185 RepID=A0ABW2KZK0_9PROT